MGSLGVLIVASILSTSVASAHNGADPEGLRQRCKEALQQYLTDHPDILENQLAAELNNLDFVRRQMIVEARYLSEVVGTSQQLGTLHSFKALFRLAERGQKLITSVQTLHERLNAVRGPQQIIAVHQFNPRESIFRAEMDRHLMIEAMTSGATIALELKGSVDSDRALTTRYLRNRLMGLEDVLHLDEDALPHRALSAGNPAVTIRDLTLSSVANDLPAPLTSLAEALQEALRNPTGGNLQRCHQRAVELYADAVTAVDKARSAERNTQLMPNAIETAITEGRQPLIERQGELWASGVSSVAALVIEVFHYLSLEDSVPHIKATLAGLEAAVKAARTVQPSWGEITPARAERLFFDGLAQSIREQGLPDRWLEFFVSGGHRLGVAALRAQENGTLTVINLDDLGLSPLLIHPVRGEGAVEAKLIRVGTPVRISPADPRVPTLAEVVAIQQAAGNMVRVMVEGPNAEGRIIQRWVPSELLSRVHYSAEAKVPQSPLGAVVRTASPAPRRGNRMVN